MKFREFLLKQYDTGPWLGGVKDLYGRAMGYHGVTQSFLIALTAYNTLIMRELGILPSWFSFPVFIGILGVLLFLTMVLVYKFEVPSAIEYINRQLFKHHNLIREQIDEIEKKHQEQLILILEQLKALEEKICNQ